MSPDQPHWRRVFDKAERAVGKPLEDVVGSRKYMNVAVFGRRVRGAVSGVVGRPAAAVRYLTRRPKK